MHDEILDALRHIELTHQVRVLYACESGSRAWGVPSRDSDYDVRFIYIHPSDWYLSIDEGGDVIELPVHDRLDISGWDIRKALRLFRKSNPSMLEWLQSDIVYAESGSAAERIRSLMPAVFSPRTCVQHYLNMARNNFRTELQKDAVKVKSYFYVLRPILACLWIERLGTVPPASLCALQEAILPKGELSREIERLTTRKMAGEELDLEPEAKQLLHHFIHSEIERMQTASETFGKAAAADPTTQLDILFRELLQENAQLR
ncbi:nucleotidyltransferase domain-containing protein [Paenibacillus sp. PvR148]